MLASALASERRVRKGRIRARQESCRQWRRENSGCFIISSDNCTHREAKYMSTYNLQPYPAAGCQLAVTSQTSGQTHLLTQNSWPLPSLQDCAFNCACGLRREEWVVYNDYILIPIIYCPRDSVWQSSTDHTWNTSHSKKTNKIWDKSVYCEIWCVLYC